MLPKLFIGKCIQKHIKNQKVLTSSATSTPYVKHDNCSKAVGPPMENIDKPKMGS